MLRLSKITDYGVLILRIMVTNKPSQLMSAREISDQIQVGLPTVSKVLKSLVSHQLVESVRGSNGGYQLCHDADQITIAQVIDALEGEMAITQCSGAVSTCSMHDQCALKPSWQVVNEVIATVLSNITLADMMSNLSTQQILTRMMEPTPA